MNFFPGLYEKRGHRKSVSFSNPLTGQIYNNKFFAKNVDLEETSSTRFIYKQTHKSDKKQQAQNKKLKAKTNMSCFNRDQNEKNLQQKFKFQREVKAIFTTNRLANLNNKSIFCKKSQLLNNQNFQQDLKDKELSKTVNLKPINIYEVDKNHLKIRKKQNQQKQNSDIFPNIQVLILDIINEHTDLQTKIIGMNLQKYFRSFFKKQLTGNYTSLFLQKVQNYIKYLLSSKSYCQPIDQKSYSPQIFSIVTRISFMNKIQQLQQRNSQYGLKNILAMIKYYCIPSEQFRQSCLRDIKLMLTLQIYQKFNCNKNQEYVLLNQKGKQIQDILQIGFSTKKLFLSKKAKVNFNYNKFIKMINQYYNSQQKFSFNQNLKYSFRKKIAKGNYDQNQINYAQDPQTFIHKRRQQIQKAESVLKKKTQSNITYYSKTQNCEISKSNDRNTNIFQNSNISNQNNKISAQHQNIFWKQESKFISPQTSPRNRSPSLKQIRGNSPKRTHSPQKQKQLSKQKFKNLINFSKSKGLTKRLQQKFQNQYKRLVSQNDIYDITFNHLHQNKLSYSSWINNFIFFKGKSEKQTKKIIEALFDVCQISSSFKNNIQFKQVYLDFEQFKNIRCIIECFQPSQNIMKFVAKYLNFNQFGQLTKNDLFEQLKIILQGNQTGIIEVILQVIWSWFQSNSVLENKVIRRIILQSWYQKYKIVYCMLVSLIFGTNHTTALDLAYQILH